VAVSPPPPVEVAPVRETVTKVYTITAEDRDFRVLSQKHYGTPEYADALLKFNRDFPMATAGVRQDPPVLQPGMRVYIPDLPTLKQGTSTSPVQITPAPPAKVGEGPAVPPAVPVQVPPLQVSPTPPPPPGGLTSSRSNLNAIASTGGKADGKVYQVAAGGEMLLTIAQRELGSSSRWPEIYHLNEQVDPSRPIPAGTLLRLPVKQ
jgi:nucleoid-associated protein YgaU